MKTVQAGLALAFVLIAGIATPMSSASASSAGLLGKRSGYLVTPVMMHAIDVIAAEQKKMHRHR